MQEIESINLSLFRKVNKIKQKDLAILLGTTPNFLSIVEAGKSKLPDSKIDIILKEAKKQNWDISDFNPAFYRLVFLCSEVQASVFPNDNNHNLNLDWDTGNNPFGIPESDILKIKHGKIGITEAIANKILDCNSSYNIKWLLNGDGTPFNITTEIYDTRDKTEYEILMDRMDHICTWLSSIYGCQRYIIDQQNRIEKQLANKVQVTNEQ